MDLLVRLKALDLELSATRNGNSSGGGGIGGTPGEEGKEGEEGGFLIGGPAAASGTAAARAEVRAPFVGRSGERERAIARGGEKKKKRAKHSRRAHTGKSTGPCLLSSLLFSHACACVATALVVWGLGK